MAPMLASLDLDGDHATDLWDGVEAAFQVSFADDDRDYQTVGDLHRNLLTLFPPAVGDGRCATSMSFYRLRAALAPVMPGRVTPATPLGGSMMTPRALGRRVEALPGWSALVGTGGWLTVAGLASPVIGLVVALVLHDPRWLWFVAGLSLLWMDEGAYGRQTVGDLAREAAALNFAELARAGADHRPEAVWTALRQVIACHFDVDPRRIGPQTRLFPAAPSRCRPISPI